MGKPHRRNSIKQVAALPWRREADGSVRVLLVTSRERGRWILPKGWPMKGRRDAEAAAIEAMEEAGVVGKIGRKPIGAFQYQKIVGLQSRTVKVQVYPLEVERRLDDWPEKGQRQLRWFLLEDAGAIVEDAGGAILAFARSLGPPSITAETEQSTAHPQEPRPDHPEKSPVERS